MITHGTNWWIMMKQMGLTLHDSTGRGGANGHQVHKLVVGGELTL